MWSNVIGEARAKHVLQSALEHAKLPGAYLFNGPEGVGKDAVAFELAKAVNCLAPKSNGTEACDECASCLAISSLTSPALLFVHAIPGKDDGKEDDQKEEDLAIIREQRTAKAADPYHNIEIPRATSIKIGQIRELRLALSRSLAGSKKRVVIISEADMMNSQAQNAFLKTLEEPHADTLIILSSSNAARLLPTVHSRCQEVRFEPLQPEDIASALQEREEISQEQASFLARLAAGSYSRARQMIGENVQQMRDEIVGFLRMGLSRSRKNAAVEIDRFLPRSAGGSYLEKRQAVEQRLMLLTLWLRDALALATKADEEIVNLDQKEALTRFVTRFGEPHRIIAAIGSVDRAMYHARLQLQLRPVMFALIVDLESALL